MACTLSNGNYQQNLFCVEPFAFTASWEKIRIICPTLQMGNLRQKMVKQTGKSLLTFFVTELGSICHSLDHIPGPVFYKFSDEKQWRKILIFQIKSCLQINWSLLNCFIVQTRPITPFTNYYFFFYSFVGRMRRVSAGRVMLARLGAVV